MPTLYGVNASPFVRKVRVVLAEKGVPYDHEPVMPGNPDPEYRQMSPLGKVPAWRDGERAFSDSSVICQYLERVHPEPALYPSDPYDFARALWFEEYADTALIDVFGPKIFFPRVVGKRFMGKEPDETAIGKTIDEELPPRFDYLEGQLRGGPFLVADRLTIADIAVASAFVNLAHGEVRPDGGRWPRLAKYVATHHERPSFAPLIVEEQAFLGLA
ncbi:MAG TPA: glutathione S-transferase family protein [Haliangiales bacterium]|nr:glutathione S-transferase family protein [Haliangiales bacterium]